MNLCRLLWFCIINRNPTELIEKVFKSAEFEIEKKKKKKKSKYKYEHSIYRSDISISAVAKPSLGLSLGA